MARAFWLFWLSLSVAAAQSATDLYLRTLAHRYLDERGAAIAQLKTPEAIAARQKYVRERMIAEIGGFPEKTPLNARITGTVEREGYRVEKLLFESMPGFYVTANVYVPKSVGPFPAVLGTAGHTDNGKASAIYQHGWIAMAKRGMLVLAYDPPGQGERLLYFDPQSGRSKIGAGTAEHIQAGVQCLLAGTNFARYEIWDGIRAFDYLLTRKDVDPRRIAVAGNSGGGTQTAYLQVFEPRLAAAAPSCYPTSWRQLWDDPGPQDAEQNFAGFLADGLDFGDFFLAFAPKPVKIHAAIRDFFPIEGARATFREERRIYETIGAEQKIGFFEFDDTHGWSKPRRESTYQWFDRWLLGKETNGAEPEFDTEYDRDLEVTAGGQVASLPRSETVQSLTAKEAAKLYAQRRAANLTDSAALRRIVGERLRLTTGARPIDAAGDRLRVPPFGPERKPAILYLNPAYQAGDADAASMERMGYVVYAPLLRGWELPAAERNKSGYNAYWKTSMRAILVNKSLTGMQVEDALAAFAYLAGRGDVDPSRIGVHGKGSGGVVALHVAALEPRVAKVATESAIVSYMDVIRAPLHSGMAELIVPGVILDYDLPDLERMIAPRKVWRVDPRTPAGVRTVERGISRREGASWERVYREW